MSRWMVSGGAGRLVVALGVGALDGLGDDGRFIGAAVVVGSFFFFIVVLVKPNLALLERVR